jgi:hypothetical protein
MYIILNRRIYIQIQLFIDFYTRLHTYYYYDVWNAIMTGG